MKQEVHTFGTRRTTLQQRRPTDLQDPQPDPEERLDPVEIKHIPDTEDRCPGERQCKECQEPRGDVHNRRDVVSFKVLGQSRILSLEEPFKHQSVNPELSQRRREIVVQIPTLQGRDQEPEGFLDRHLHQHHPDKTAHSLTVAYTGFVMCIGLEDRVKILLASAAHPVSEMDMIRVAPVDVACNHVMDGEVAPREEVLEEARLAVMVDIGEELPDASSDRWRYASSRQFLKLFCFCGCVSTSVWALQGSHACTHKIRTKYLPWSVF